MDQADGQHPAKGRGNHQGRADLRLIGGDEHEDGFGDAGKDC